jgi:cysteinyl-tRNA synthetase
MSGEKMAKRTGNFARPADVYATGTGPRALRYALLAAHYRAPLDFSAESLVAASAAVERLSTLLATLDAYREDRADDPSLPPMLHAACSGFEAALDDDLAIAPALGAVFELARDLNRRIAERRLSTADAIRAATLLRDLDRVLAVMEEEPETLPPGAGRLLDERAEARSARQWARSDEIRDQLAGLGVIVEDTRDGQRWRLAEVGHGET